MLPQVFTEDFVNHCNSEYSRLLDAVKASKGIQQHILARADDQSAIAMRSFLLYGHRDGNPTFDDLLQSRVCLDAACYDLSPWLGRRTKTKKIDEDLLYNSAGDAVSIIHRDNKEEVGLAPISSYALPKKFVLNLFVIFKPRQCSLNCKQVQEVLRSPPHYLEIKRRYQLGIDRWKNRIRAGHPDKRIMAEDAQAWGVDGKQSGNDNAMALNETYLEDAVRKALCGDSDKPKYLEEHITSWKPNEELQKQCEGTDRHPPEVEVHRLEEGDNVGFLLRVKHPHGPEFLEAKWQNTRNVKFFQNKDYGGDATKNVLKSLRGPKGSVFALSEGKHLFETIPLTDFDGINLEAVNFLNKAVVDAFQATGCQLCPSGGYDPREGYNLCQEVFGDLAGSAYGVHSDDDVTNCCDNKRSPAWNKLPTTAQMMVPTLVVSGANESAKLVFTSKETKCVILEITISGDEYHFQCPYVQQYFDHEVQAPANVANSFRSVTSFRKVLKGGTKADIDCLQLSLKFGCSDAVEYSDRKPPSLHKCTLLYFI